MAILAPQGLDYVASFFAVLKSGSIAVPLFAPELPGHAERLHVALADATPALLVTTTAASEAVEAFVRKLPGTPPPVLVVDDIPDSAGAEFISVDIGMGDVSHLQYTSGATRPPVGVEITHRAFVTNLVQMILSIDLLNRNTHGVSWLPLYHDMGLLMIMFPALSGGYLTLMSPLAFVRRPSRWIAQLGAHAEIGRTFAAAPNFAFELAAQRGLPAPGEKLDLKTVQTPIYVQSSKEDHIAPFKSVYRGAKLFGGPVNFMMAGSGHIAGVINHPAAQKYQYWTNSALPDTVEAWAAGAEEQPGSWWPNWGQWLAECGVPVSDFYSLLVDKLDLARGGKDKFHWNGPAYQILGDKCVEEVLKALSTK